MSQLPRAVPPPPPAPPIPTHWPGRTLPQSRSSKSSSAWPHRLLYVPTMTSYVREDTDTYNGVSAPLYNILSYTWGNFQDRTRAEIAISINGVDWPIPAIRKEHFTADTFKTAMVRAANGVKHRCEWLWVDIACIPQRHRNETEMARKLRGQEVGRQVEIFRHAQEAFAWLSHMKTSELCESVPVLNIVDFIDHINQGVLVRTHQDAENYLNTCEIESRLFETWMSIFLAHPWLSSLWTLQEMILRQDAWVLFDDGFLDLYNDGQNIPWNFMTIKNDVYALRAITDGHVTIFLENAERIVVSGGSKIYKGYADVISERLKKLLEVQVLKGLDCLRITLPNTVYSAAQYRNARELKDRIYGVVQTYDISCNPDPTGEDETAKLHALEDEFGSKLIAKSALLSQIFIHSSEEPPRRSWLITQKCIVDSFWESFNSTEFIVNELGSLKFQEETGNVQFNGKGWYLDSFFESQDDQLFKSNSGSSDTYLGLLLDHHISKEVLGHLVEYFESREQMLQSIENLCKFYGEALRIALLGSGSHRGMPVVSYLGVVLAPLENVTGNPNWARIGLVRWKEIYNTDRSLPHYHLPDYHDFQCIII